MASDAADTPDNNNVGAITSAIHSDIASKSRALFAFFQEDTLSLLYLALYYISAAISRCRYSVTFFEAVRAATPSAIILLSLSDTQYTARQPESAQLSVPGFAHSYYANAPGGAIFLAIYATLQ